MLDSEPRACQESRVSLAVNLRGLAVPRKRGQQEGGTMRMTTRSVLTLALFVTIAMSSARAESPPSNARRVAGALLVDSTLTPLPISIPDGWVLALTDVSNPGQVQIFSADDTEHPIYVGSTHAFRTGLLFSAPPVVVGAGSWFSFSGYVMPADYTSRRAP